MSRLSLFELRGLASFAPSNALISSLIPTSPFQPLSARYCINFLSSRDRSTPVISGTKKYATRIPKKPNIAAMMNVHLPESQGCG